ncbi:hypothetical protein SteCoe_17553 [Stentor coeruleus]|uniref:Uncharacterized protein n=1 Tax=Stentor coeruleus TaxID=5963 RepID=A0A1R2BYW5_9CILI|nr:hypothetical protein SteCoe_17553 [Stentor coeruleus]
MIEILFSDISDSEATYENTDSEEYEDVHNALEQNEYFVRARPEIRKVKANGRSTDKIHAKGKTGKNLAKNLKKLEKLVPDDTFQDYLDEGIHYLPWPVIQPYEFLTLTFNNLT